MDEAPVPLPPPRVPFRPKDPLISRGAVEKIRPGAPIELVNPLALIWDEVLHRIFCGVMELGAEDQSPLDINLREEMILELAMLKLWLADLVVAKRVGERQLADIDPEVERRQCLGPEGESAILSTAKMIYDRIWAKLMEQRWKPKTQKAFERDANPPQPKPAVKPVGKNHYIPRWFIRDHWALDGKVMRWRRTDSGWRSALRAFGRWGFGHKLYSDDMEAVMGLVEGNAKKPVQMLLDTRPLNLPQRQWFVGFLAIQILRSPFFEEAIREQLRSVLAELGYDESPEMAAQAYEALAGDDFYHKLADPIMGSRWALVSAETPLFVLPDTFGARSGLGEGLRMIVPLTPTLCFVTLPGREAQKRIVPLRLTADDALARRISVALIGSAAREFLSHPDFRPDDGISEESLSDLLHDIEAAIDLKEVKDDQAV